MDSSQLIVGQILLTVLIVQLLGFGCCALSLMSFGLALNRWLDLQVQMIQFIPSSLLCTILFCIMILCSSNQSFTSPLNPLGPFAYSRMPDQMVLSTFLFIVSCLVVYACWTLSAMILDNLV